MNGNDSPEALSKVIFDGMSIPPFRPLRVNARQRFEEIRELDTCPDDVIVTTYPKSGSHWVWEIVGMLLRGKPVYVKEGKESVFLEALDDLDVINSMTSPRPLNTHVPYRWLPMTHLKNGGKIVHVIRNPKDVAVSMFFHFKGSGEFVNSERITFDDCIDRMLSYEPNQPYGGWFAYERDFLQQAAVDNASIHILHFERLKRHPREEIKRLADYLGVRYTDQLIEDISERCNFTNMKEADDTIKEKTIYKSIVLGANPTYQGDITKVNPKSFFREGKVGNWKEHFTVSQSERFNAFYNDQMQDFHLHVEFE